MAVPLRRALLIAALSFLQLHDPPREATLLRHWLDSWAALADVIAGLTRQQHSRGHIQGTFAPSPP